MGLDHIVFSVKVSETSRDRDYWATRAWASERTRDNIRSADVLILPWENFRDNKPALFPQGTPKITRALCSDLRDKKIALGIDDKYYEEITLHADHIRWPTILVTSLLLPALASVIGNRIDRALPGYSEEKTEERNQSKLAAADKIIELEVIVEGKRGHCISIKYEGPVNKVVDTVLAQATSCLPHVEAKPRRNAQ